MAQEDTKKEKPFDPEEVRKAFGVLRERVTRLEARLAGTNELAKRARDLASSAERRADICRLDAHAAEAKSVTCKLDMDNTWRFVQKALEDIVALSGRVRMLEDANGAISGGHSDSGLGADGDRDGGPAGPREESSVDISSA